MGLAAGAKGEEAEEEEKEGGRRGGEREEEEWLRRKQSVKELQPSKMHAFSPNRLYCVN